MGPESRSSTLSLNYSVSCSSFGSKSGPKDHTNSRTLQTTVLEFPLTRALGPECRILMFMIIYNLSGVQSITNSL